MPYSPSGQAYATAADLSNFGLSQQALSHPSTGPTVIAQQLLAASQDIDAILRIRFQLPLIRWGSDIVQKTCALAALRIVTIRGYDPSSDGVWDKLATMAMDWLKLVAANKATPDVTDSSPNAGPGVPAPAATPNFASPTVINTSGVSQRGCGKR